MNQNAIKVSRTILKKNIEAGLIKLSPFANFIEDDFDLTAVNEEIRAEVTKVFSEVLDKDIKEIDPHAHFIFDLGGTSLDYISLLVKLKSIFDIDFSMGEASLSSVNDFCKFIIRKKSLE